MCFQPSFTLPENRVRFIKGITQICEKEIIKAVRDEEMDFIIMLAREEGHLEHFLFGRSNEEIIRKMPFSVLPVMKESGPVTF
jgi:hypothetical protein